MKIKTKPKKPTRKTIKDEFWVDIGGDMSLDGIRDGLLRQIKQQLSVDRSYYKRIGLTIESYDSFILKEKHCWDNSEFFVVGTRQETDNEFNERVEDYKKRLAVYNKWLKENKANIKIELERREKVKKEKAKAEKDKIRKQIERLQKKLKNQT